MPDIIRITIEPYENDEADILTKALETVGYKRMSLIITRDRVKITFVKEG